MNKLTVGKFFGLQHISTYRGTFTCLALDHRQNLRKALNPQNPLAVNDKQISLFKMGVTSALASEATAILLDPEFSAAQAIASHRIPSNVGLIVALESTGYTGDPTARQAQVLPGWSVAKAKRMGASAIKLLVYYHPDSPIANQVESFTQQVADECKQHDIILMLEPLSYSLDETRSLTSHEKREVVIETARKLTPLGIDILKAEFPLDVSEKDENAWKKACNELSTASKTPWILLSAAVSYETFLRQVAVACNAGASGVAVGRAVWQEAVGMTQEKRVEFLNTTGQERLSRLTSLCHSLGRPWQDFYSLETSFDWYKSY